MTSPYSPVTWNAGDFATKERMSQMANNDQWLFENISKVTYRASGINRGQGMKVLAIRTPYGATTARQVRVDVYFGGYFSAGCSPICTATAISHPQKRLNVTLSGLGGTAFPDAIGCMAQVEADEMFSEASTGGSIHVSGAVDLIAVGW